MCCNKCNNVQQEPPLEVNAVTIEINRIVREADDVHVHKYKHIVHEWMRILLPKSRHEATTYFIDIFCIHKFFDIQTQTIFIHKLKEKRQTKRKFSEKDINELFSNMRLMTLPKHTWVDIHTILHLLFLIFFLFIFLVFVCDAKGSRDMLFLIFWHELCVTQIRIAIHHHNTKRYPFEKIKFKDLWIC